MTFNQLKMALYSIVITNYYGLRLKNAKNLQEKKSLRIEYAQKLLNKLNIQIEVINEEKLPKDGQYLLISNHRTIIDPLIVEIATKNSKVFGYWISKKELYNSLFFGLFVRNGGSVLLDRDATQMNGFFKDVKECVKEGNSIYMFPEGTRNKSDAPIGKFKEGAQIIAIKNRLPILPVFIHARADATLMSAIKSSSQRRTISIEIGDIIDHKDKGCSIQESFKKQFNIKDSKAE
ncbi:lysophospholipid acyltransferase family protein [Sulfurimonas sp.]|uniref:lysophospholipid acyltransferase family protein n=1 Tax=Sulfurimonas sp. TaxID=2022749 RepID=UPI0025FC6347|nr:lysophospholipid acyltransferase family protein [Sulfurimonas sp.]MDD5157967.1 lysophospholipid acyltransferase family protein [Sulfurimonas sp.]